ncbi:S1 family peptidase [Parvularcula maris]|uniref:Serine protease n=1 Tax=Parvularcula maris TaxID=2965077 RepID=A0A9X2LAP9_9PROT|nr:serine protease [Parvularcula maris]MCQ8186184.1 serine protease [Parvularcula maris]
MAKMTCRLEMFDGELLDSTGTGFFWKSYPFGTLDKFLISVITNKHVIGEYERVGFVVDVINKDGIIQHVRVHVEGIQSIALPHPEPDCDLIAINFSTVIDALGKTGPRPDVIVPDSRHALDLEQRRNLMAVEEIVVVGYPDGLWDSCNNTPVFRKGISATPPYNDFEGRPEFLIDCAIYPGSSGSPVFLASSGAFGTKDGKNLLGSRMLLLGVVHSVFQHASDGELRIEPAPTATTIVPTFKFPNNIGICLYADKIIELDKLICKQFVDVKAGNRAQGSLRVQFEQI